jgi:N-acetylglucosaminyldiphosphoundecaprenol N-acetyl-beta-D-mannosaminyltransferase
MIFVTGASRSGTTLIAQMLGQHDTIAGLREMQYFGEFCDPRTHPPSHPVDAADAVAAMFERQNQGIVASRGRRSSDPEIPRVLDALPPQAGAAEIFAGAAAGFARRAGKSLPCEQTPRNIYYARQLLDWYPQARFVHMLRDPRGVMASQKHRWRRRMLMADPSRMRRTHQFATWVNYHPYTVTQLWSLATRLALDLERQPRFMMLRFEDLIVDPEARMRDVCTFLGVGYQPAMLDIEHVNSSYIATPTAARGLNHGSLNAWQGKLSVDERALIHRRCAELMERVGYHSEPVAMTGLGPIKLGLRYLVHAGGAALMNPRRVWIQRRALLSVPRLAPQSSASQPLANSATQPPQANGSTATAEPSSSGAEAGSDGPSVPVFGLPCVDCPPDTAAQHLVQCAAAGVRRRVAFVNAHTLNVSIREPSLQRALQQADIIYADGIGMAVAARIQGKRLTHNVNGTDLFPHLCRHAAAAGVSIALLGAAPGVAQRCVQVLAERYPALQVAWYRHGYGADEETAELIEVVNRSGAGILLVAMGVPRQECWIMEHRERLEIPVVMGVGGLFDFVSGRVPRAPQRLRRMRLEWLFRLMVEPRRLFARYVVGNLLFLLRACRYAVTGQLGPAPKRLTSR